MPTLTTTQMNALQTKITNGDIAGFYTDLSNYGDAYGNLALSQTNNTGWQAQLSNAFAESAARDNEVNLAYGSTAWSNLNKDLANRYLDAYRANSGAVPTGNQVKDLHNDGYDAAGLNANDWLPNRLLNDSSDPGDLWNDLLSNQGGADLWDDTYNVAGAGAALAFPPYFTAAALTDPDFVGQIAFARDFFNAFNQLDNSARTAMALDVGSAGLSALADFANSVPGAVSNLIDALNKLLDNPQDALDRLLPDWLPGFLDPITGLLGIFPGAGGIGGGAFDPLVFDLDASGTIDLLSVENGVQFDFWGDGLAEKVGWVSPTDGMLAIDLDSSGTIDNAPELFGSEIPLTYLMEDNFDSFINEENGFARLAKYDLVANGGNNDGAITSADDVWTDLIMWQDANSDGVSQSGEMHTLSYFIISSIDVSAYELDSFGGGGAGGFGRVIEGNIITHTGAFTMGGVEREVVDVWFDSDLLNTSYVVEYTLDERVLFLPTVRGYGMIPDLYIAMSQNENLLDDVAGFVSGNDFGDLFDGATTDIENIMLDWAGIDPNDLPDFDYSKHGMFEELKEYWFLRKFTGQDNDGLGTWFDQTPYLPYVSEGAAAIQEAYGNLLDAFSARLIFQSGGLALFEDGVTYNPYTDEFDGTFALSHTAVDDLETAAGLSADAEGYWRAVAKFIDNTMGISELSGTEIGWLDDAVDDSTSSALSWSDIVTLLDVQVIGGTSGSDTVNGTDYDDAIYGDDLSNPYLDTGNDILNGGAGNDRLYGGEQGYNGTNDTLNGGLGNDYLEGGYGADTYIYDYGHDVILDVSMYSDTDIIELAAGIDEEDVTIHFARFDSMAPHLFLEIAGRGTITIQTFLAVDMTTLIDEIHFANSTVWTLGTAPVHIHGTYRTEGVASNPFAGDDFLYGYGGDDIMSGYSGDDTLDGGIGNDDMRGDIGDDTYIISAGSDIIRETDGEDTILIPEGYTLDDISFLRVEAEAMGANYDEIKIVVEGLGEIMVLDHLLGSGKEVEKLKLHGGAEIDLLSYVFTTVGTSGNDFIQGTNGSWTQQDDIYLFGTGNDEVYEYGGHDILQFDEGILPGDITVSRTPGDSATALTFSDAFGNSMSFHYHFGSSATTTALEQVKFANGTIWNLSAIEVQTHGTSSGDNIFDYDWGDASTNDTIFAYGGADQVAGGAGNDEIHGGDGDDYYLSGWTGNDLIYGDDGDDVLYGEADDDVLIGGAGNDTIDGGSEIDIVSYVTAASGVTVNLATTTGQNTGGAGTDTITNVENIIGSAYNDTLTGDGSANTIEGGAGNDTLNGAGGTDTLSYVSAGAGITINLATATGQNTGGAGTDTVSSFENLRGSAYNDTLTGTSGNNVIEGGAGNDTINGQGGTDTLTYANASGAVTVSLAVATGQNTVGAGTDTISNMENLTGSAYGDTLTGSTAANTINGGDGDDTIEGGAGNDTLTGGSGTDTVSYSSAGSAITFNLATTSGQNTVGAGTDTVSGFENLRGSAFNDTLTGNSSNNTIEGGAGNDTINGSGGTDTLSYANAGSGVTVNLSTAAGQNTGGAGTDTISSMENLIGSAHNDTLTGTSSANTIQGGAGADTISAGGGADFLYGGAGADTLTGSTGGDAFIFEAATALGASDTITDFSTAQVDELDVSDILSAYDPLTHAISDFVRITDNGTHSFLSVDADGGGNSFTQIAQLSSVTNISAGATATEIELQAMITAGTLVV